jgi:transposase
MEKNNDATLEELSELLHEATGVKVGKTTIGKISQKLNYSVKKKHYMLQKNKRRKC